ncbi:hypothetical protein HDU79_001648 [Rhizoclosmatium sp. JEL0117]|nr:hypothetical protein HDU79_001648 [Rhizoclosmatium sp. JEL0117]
MDTEHKTKIPLQPEGGTGMLFWATSSNTSPKRQPLRLPRRRLHRRVQVLMLAAVFVVCLFFVFRSRSQEPQKPEFVTHKHSKLEQSANVQEGTVSNKKIPLHEAAHRILNVMEKDPVKKKEEIVPIEMTIPMEEIVKEIDLLQSQFMDYLNGEEGKLFPRVFGGTLQSIKEPFNVQSVWIKINRYAREIADEGSYPRSQFLYMGRFARANLIAYTVLYDKPSLQPLLKPKSQSNEEFTAELERLVADLSKTLYPWMSPTFKSIKDIQTHFQTIPKGKPQEGIIFTTGKWHFELTVHAIMTLRKVLNCSLPIEVHYGGPSDLTPQMIKAFNALPNTVAIDTVTNYFTSETKKFGGWSLKPFALLASSFASVIFIDADALFFQDPHTLLHSATFAKHGQVFFHDRSLFRNDPVEWFRGINPHHTHYASTLRYMNGLSWHEMESGVVVVDKRVTGNLHALMAVCNMNSKVERDEVTYKKMHGDKETYWISWDLLRVPYSFVPTYGGTVGYKNSTTGAICGGLFHTDEHQRPLWWNGGVIANKHHNKDGQFMTFDYAAFDTDADKIKWDWETPTTPFCLMPRYDWEIVELNPREKGLGKQFVDIYVDIKERGWVKFLEDETKVPLDE